VWSVVLSGGVGAVLGPFFVKWAYQLIGVERHNVLAISMMTAILLTAIALRWGGSPALPAFCWLGMTGIALTIIDINFHRLPHYLVGAMGVGGIVLLGVAQPSWLLRAVVAVVVAAGALFLMGVLSRGQIGFGDVTLCAAVSLYTGWLGWRYVVLALLAATLLAGLIGVFLLVTRRAGIHDRFAFGPLLVTGGIVVLLLP
jgi:leader peptidase (prepilin peptidase)/N-methyltransferase